MRNEIYPSETNRAGQDLLDAYRRLREVELEIGHLEDYRYDRKYLAAELKLNDVLFDLYEKEVSVTRKPDASPITITRVKTMGGKVLGYVDQVSGYLNLYQAAFCGSLIVHKQLPNIPFVTDKESPWLNKNFRRQYRIFPFMGEYRADDFRPAVDINVH